VTAKNNRNHGLQLLNYCLFTQHIFKFLHQTHSPDHMGTWITQRWQSVITQ